MSKDRTLCRIGQMRFIIILDNQNQQCIHQKFSCRTQLAVTNGSVQKQRDKQFYYPTIFYFFGASVGSEYRARNSAVDITGLS